MYQLRTYRSIEFLAIRYAVRIRLKYTCRCVNSFVLRLIEIRRVYGVVCVCQHAQAVVNVMFLDCFVIIVMFMYLVHACNER